MKLAHKKSLIVLAAAIIMVCVAGVFVIRQRSTHTGLVIEEIPLTQAIIDKMGLDNVHYGFSYQVAREVEAGQFLLWAPTVFRASYYAGADRVYVYALPYVTYNYTDIRSDGNHTWAASFNIAERRIVGSQIDYGSGFFKYRNVRLELSAGEGTGFIQLFHQGSASQGRPWWRRVGRNANDDIYPIRRYSDRSSMYSAGYYLPNLVFYESTDTDERTRAGHYFVVHALATRHGAVFNGVAEGRLHIAFDVYEDNGRSFRTSVNHDIALPYIVSNP